jgi:hypothetical protein
LIRCRIGVLKGPTIDLAADRTWKTPPMDD